MKRRVVSREQEEEEERFRPRELYSRKGQGLVVGIFDKEKKNRIKSILTFGIVEREDTIR